MFKQNRVVSDGAFVVLTPGYVRAEIPGTSDPAELLCQKRPVNYPTTALPKSYAAA